MAFIVGVLLVPWFFLSVPRPPQRARGGSVGSNPTLSATTRQKGFLQSAA